MDAGIADNQHVDNGLSNKENSKITVPSTLPPAVPDTIKPTLSFQDEEEEESEVDMETVKQTSVAATCRDTGQIGMTEGRLSIKIKLLLRLRPRGSYYNHPW